MKNTLESSETGIAPGTGPEKEASKPKERTLEIKNTIPTLFSTKEKFETKKHELSSKLEAFDSKSLSTAENI
jgi:hypothetical protein